MEQGDLLVVTLISLIALFLLFIISFYIIIFRCCLRGILNENEEHREHREHGGNDIEAAAGLN